jgi:hypothetical protein
LVATIVNDVELKTAFGVPDIAQVSAFKVAQSGSAIVGTLIAHPVIAEPLGDNIAGVMDIAVPKVPFVPAAPE